VATALLYAALVSGAVPILLAPRASALLNTATLKLSSPKIVPGQTVTATLTVTEDGTHPYNVPTQFTSTGDVRIACVNFCRTDSNGQAVANLTVGGGYGSQSITGTATFIDSTTASASAPLFEYDTPTKLTEVLSAGTMNADGISTVSATATLTDSAGRGVAAEPVTISTSDPDVLFTAVRDNGDGTYTTTISAIPGAAATDTITAVLASAGLNAGQTLALTNPLPKVKGPLTTSGTQIIDKGASGGPKPVVLKGADAVNWGYAAAWDNDPTGYYGALDPGLLRPAAVGNLYRWGANYVRVMLSSDLYLQNCPGETYPVSQADYAADVRKEVNLITSFGMVAVLDLHFVNPKRNDTGFCYFSPTKSSDTDQTRYSQYGSAVPLPPKSDAVAFFQDLASHLGSNPLVAFELYNEPGVCGTAGTTAYTTWSDACKNNDDYNSKAWGTDGTVSTADAFAGPLVYSGAGMQSLFDTVRQNGAPNNLVFVDSNNWAQDPHTFNYVCATPTSGCYLHGGNLVYVFHEYLCGPDQSKATQVDCGNATPETCATITANMSSKLADRAKWPAPVDFDEFGWPQSAAIQYTYVDSSNNNTRFTPYNNGLYINNVIAYADAHGIGWGVFAYENDVNPVWQGPYALTTDTSTVPWKANADGQAAIDDMQGTTAHCR
jgi:hypothetical protein